MRVLLRLIAPVIAAAATAALLASPAAAQEDSMTDTPRWSLAIHGGAGVLTPDRYTPEQVAEYRAALDKALEAGGKVLSDGGAAMALTVTHISAATASLSWALWEKIKFGKASLVGIVTGTIAGLASITPASGFVGPVEALIIGAIAGVLCQEAVTLIRNGLKIDDTLDVFAVHGVGGIFGTIMIAAFGAASWAAQLGSLLIVGVFTVVVSVVLVKLVGLVTPLRVDAETEHTGLDLAVHGERAYEMTS